MENNKALLKMIRRKKAVETARITKKRRTAKNLKEHIMSERELVTTDIKRALKKIDEYIEELKYNYNETDIDTMMIETLVGAKALFHTYLEYLEKGHSMQDIDGDYFKSVVDMINTLMDKHNLD